jgi:hypothetical protein
MENKKRTMDQKFEQENPLSKRFKKAHINPTRKKKIEKNEEVVQKILDQYNNIEDKGIKSREDSEIKGLLDFNNWLKSVLIQKYTNNNSVVLGKFY